MTSLDLGLLVLRVVAGLIFAAHGAQKTFGWWSGPGLAGWRASMDRMGLRPAAMWAVISAATELFGGLFLAVGLLTPLTTALLIGQSIVIIALVHLPRGLWNKDQGIEFPLALAAAFVAIAATGPGAISLDAYLGLAMSPVVHVVLLLGGVAGGLTALAVSRLPRQMPVPQPN